MTARCHGATSSAKPGLGATVYIGPAAIGALFNNAPTAWAVPIAGFIGAVTYELATFCTADPPAVPTFSASDVEAILNPMDLIPFGNAVNKFRDLIGALTWNDLCKCDDASAPIVPTAPAAPTGSPTISPPQVGGTYPAVQPCQVTHYAMDVPGDGANHILPSIVLPDGHSYMTVDGYFTDILPTTSGDLTFSTLGIDSSGGLFGGYSVGNHLAIHNVHHSEGVTFPNWVRWQGEFNNGSTQPTRHMDVDVRIYCGTTPTGVGGPVPQPCPTDPFVIATLEQIKALVTIIQRQKVPFAYVTSTPHSGLTGSGHLDVNGLLGCKVQLDTFGSSVGVESGDPAEFFDAGWIVWENADGGTAREHITHSPFVSLPDLAGQFTRIGYTLGQGVTATLTELVREP